MSQPQGVSSNANPAQSYQRYFVPAMFVPGAHVLIEHAAPGAGERVLDVGCGADVMARQVGTKVGTTGTVVGLDINPATLTVARSLPAPEGAAITWQEGSVMEIPFPEAAFDLVVCQQGLQFSPDRVVAMQEMRRVLRRGGRVAISVNQALENNLVYEALCGIFRARAAQLYPAVEAHSL